jgi:hypothetical protein
MMPSFKKLFLAVVGGCTTALVLHAQMAWEPLDPMAETKAGVRLSTMEISLGRWETGGIPDSIIVSPD